MKQNNYLYFIIRNYKNFSDKPWTFNVYFLFYLKLLNETSKIYFYKGLKTYFNSQSKHSKMIWQGVSKYEYNRLFGILVKLTHPDDYIKFKLFISQESQSKFNINKNLF